MATQTEIAQAVTLPRPDVRLLPLSKLVIDPSYQRTLNRRWVKELIEDWSEAGAGYLRVSVRPGGLYAVLAGQHRREAMIALEYDNWWCEVFSDLTPEQEAHIFRLGNRQRGMHPMDDFRAAVKEGAVMETEITSEVEGAGFRIAYDKRQGIRGGITSLEALKTLWRWDVLPETLDFIRTTWPGPPDEPCDPDALGRTFLLGVGGFLRAYGEDRRFNPKRAQEMLGKWYVAALIQDGEKQTGLRGKTSGYSWQDLLQVLVREYNHKLHRGKGALPLPSFTRQELRSWRIR